MNTIITIIVSMIIFGVLILSHEFGHFIVAKKCGVVVEEFAMGMGPVLWKKETSETTYTIRAFPIGGFCQMKGEDEVEDKDGKMPDRTGSFFALHPFKKILVLAAGSFMNFVIAFLIFFMILCINGNVVTTTIDTVEETSPAYIAGITHGDTIISVDGTALEKWDELSGLINRGGGEAISFVLESESGEVREISVTPYLDSESNTYKVGIIPKVGTNVFLAFWQAIESIGMYIVLIFDVFRQIFGGTISAGEALSGPIGAAVIIGQTISMGYLYVLNIAASISISLGLFNMFPIPALDGSRVLFALIEWIKGSPVNPKWESTVHLIGMAALLLMAVVIAYKDIVMFF